jgi:hypothetical protein
LGPQLAAVLINLPCCSQSFDSRRIEHAVFISARQYSFEKKKSRSADMAEQEQQQQQQQPEAEAQQQQDDTPKLSKRQQKRLLKMER